VLWSMKSQYARARRLREARSCERTITRTPPSEGPIPGPLLSAQ
jgi:hypothetical protein